VTVLLLAYVAALLMSAFCAVQAESDDDEEDSDAEEGSDDEDDEEEEAPKAKGRAPEPTTEVSASSVSPVTWQVRWCATMLSIGVQ
jgi:hypothetical protein